MSQLVGAAGLETAAVPAWVLGHQGLGDRAVRLYGILAYLQGTAGVFLAAPSLPSSRELARHLPGCSPQGAARALTELELAGAVEISTAGDGGLATYRLGP